MKLSELFEGLFEDYTKKYHGMVTEIKYMFPYHLKPLNQSEIKYALSSIEAASEKGLSKEDWAKSVNLSEPIEATIYNDGELIIQDGHHRWLAASILNKPLAVDLKSINVKAEMLNDFIFKNNKEIDDYFKHHKSVDVSKYPNSYWSRNLLGKL
jgi:hypothetical protein